MDILQSQPQPQGGLLEPMGVQGLLWVGAQGSPRASWGSWGSIGSAGGTPWNQGLRDALGVRQAPGHISHFPQIFFTFFGGIPKPYADLFFTFFTFPFTFFFAFPFTYPLFTGPQLPAHRVSHFPYLCHIYFTL